MSQPVEPGILYFCWGTRAVHEARQWQHRYGMQLDRPVPVDEDGYH